MVKNESIIKTKVLLPQALVTLDDFGDPYLGPLVYLLAKRLNYLAFQSFDFERTWWSLFQKRVVRTKFDTYVLLTNKKLDSSETIFLLIFVENIVSS